MEKTYNPSQIESHWYEQWEQSNLFAPTGEGKPYCIMIPPPNVTGSLHMGHGFQDSLMDALIRYHRMLGDNTLWQMGTDHAGIATQMVVERQIAAQGKTRHELGREAFVDKIWDWKEHSGGRISQQLKRMGASVHWPTERFTMDSEYAAAVQKVFINLYREGLIYRGMRLVNWDPKFQTAISDLEVVSHEEKGKIWTIRYPLRDHDGYIAIATTRPETLFGDVAVAVNPNDERFTHLVGSYLHLPLTDRTIPIIADESVEMDFGTGCVKITPAHDFTDYAIGQRHQLPLINILTSTAHLNDEVPKHYQGLERYEARKKALEVLEASGLLEKEEDYMMTVPRGDRSGVVIEPFLTDQWFVKTKPLAEPALEAVRSDKIQFVPKSWEKTYYQWLEDIEDWCISRQLWWGHRIPAWYDKQFVYVGESEEEVRKHYQLDAGVELKQDEDVLDTWFSSALWPFATIGWPEQTGDLKNFYPNQVLVTGFDIIFFWVARMIMFGLKLTGEIPFHEVYVTGLIRDAQGQKMSKSKGNVLDPIDLIDGISLEDLVAKRTEGLMQPEMAKKIEEATRKEFPEGITSHGTDALRFTYYALATTGRDIRFDIGRLEGYRNFCNKIWNAARYVLMNCEGDNLTSLSSVASIHDLNLSTVDQWILSLLNKTIENAHQYFKDYRFDLAAQGLYEFTWNVYCDWYLELTKPVLIDDNMPQEMKQATRYTLLYVIEQLQRLLHPFMPFITESIWQQIAPVMGIDGKQFLVSQSYPQVDKAFINEEAERDIDWLKNVVMAIRTLRGDMNVSPAQQLPLWLAKGTDQDRAHVKAHGAFLKTLAKLEELSWWDGKEMPPSATMVVKELELHVPMAGLIDKKAELARLSKAIGKLEDEQRRSEAKLSNQSYVKNAPPAVVDQERERLQEFEMTLAKLRARYDLISDL